MISMQSSLSKSNVSSAQDQEDQLPTKAPKKRTKSGCLTCRKRRIKCGEEKPVCKNCSKTKRVCEQPVIPVTLPRSRPGRTQSLPNDASSLPQPPISLLQGVAIPDEYSDLRQDSGPSQSRSYETSRSPEAAHPVGSLPQNATEISFASTGHLPIARTYSMPSGHVVASTSYESQDPFATSGEIGQGPFNLHFGSEVLDSPGLSSHHGSEYFAQDHPVGYGVGRDMPLHDDSTQSYSTGTSFQQISSTSALSNPITQHRSEHSHALAASLGVGGIAPDGNQFWQDSKVQLTSRQQHYFQHFIQNVNLNFTLLDEDLTDLPEQIHIRPSNFWSYVIPTMATRSEPLFHAVVAISALHETNVERTSDHTALMDYHVAIKKLGNALLEHGAFERDDLLAACLVLAYFETMHGEIVRWGRHLQGAGDIVRRRIRNQYTSNQEGLYKYTADPTIADHLIWFHIHQDTIQSILSGDGLFLDLEWVEMYPVRGEPGSVTHKSDQLRVFLARIGDFACKDRTRKQGAPDENALIAATVKWETLMSMLTGWRAQLGSIFSSSAVRNTATPFGTAIIFSHPAIASCQIMSLAALLYLHRSHPMYSHVPAEAIRACAADTYMIGHDVVRILSGIMVEGVNNKSIDNGSHVKAMINAVLPVFLAGIAVQGEERRDYVDRLVQDVYTFTGWRTAFRVLQGLDVAWQRPTRDFGWTCCENESVAGTMEHERSSTLREEAPYVEMDRFELLNYASGVLGRKKVVSQQTTQSTLGTSTTGLQMASQDLGIGMVESSSSWITEPQQHYDVDDDRADQYRYGYGGGFSHHNQDPWPTGPKTQHY